VKRAPGMAALMESFFHQRLVQQRNATSATMSAYRDALRLLVLYASQRKGCSPCDLVTADLDRDVVLDFLDHLERERGNSPRTRNARLTTIRSFFRHVAATDPASMGVAQRVLAIPSKRTVSKPPRHLQAADLDALLDAPDRQTPCGRRDHALLLFLARTGARISEAVGVDAADLQLDPPRQVLLRGKGRKERMVPLAADLTSAIRALCQERGLGLHEPRAIFVGAGGERLTRFGGVHAVRRAAGRVHRAGMKHVSPHVLRHTLAMTLLQAGVDLVTIQAWLCHAQVATTHRYAEADVEMMRASLERAGLSSSPAGRFRPKDAVLRALEAVR